MRDNWRDCHDAPDSSLISLNLRAFLKAVKTLTQSEIWITSHMVFLRGPNVSLLIPWNPRLPESVILHRREIDLTLYYSIQRSGREYRSFPCFMISKDYFHFADISHTMWVCVHMCAYLCMYVYKYMCGCMCMLVCIYVYISTRVHVYVCVHMCVCMCICVYVCVCICVCVICFFVECIEDWECMNQSSYLENWERSRFSQNINWLQRMSHFGLIWLAIIFESNFSGNASFVTFQGSKLIITSFTFLLAHKALLACILLSHAQSNTYHLIVANAGYVKGLGER